ncbi:hypothetical protein [Anabaena subtropica]|uniref:Uncharacterized protein n=1 Tax=Anabaena subtropica FACHB-260 TaxID=2692884 RepID=A0ABR8CNH0_9NOST|nr:hypothetical protein [Anabaena subtropica]MBD2344752.1 hypothetical protein [Anabaena subtropica FACHB-260]
MINDLDFQTPELFGSVVFRPDFNSFKTINASQAWSLFFTGGREDKQLDSNPQIALFLTSVLVALGISGFARTFISQTFFAA